MNGIVLWQWLTVGRRRVLYACGAAILLFVTAVLLMNRGSGIRE